MNHHESYFFHIAMFVEVSILKEFFSRIIVNAWLEKVINNTLNSSNFNQQEQEANLKNSFNKFRIDTKLQC